MSYFTLLYFSLRNQTIVWVTDGRLSNSVECSVTKRSKSLGTFRSRTTTSTSFLFWASALRKMSVSKPYAHAQYGQLVLVVVLVLRSKGPHLWPRKRRIHERFTSTSLPVALNSANFPQILYDIVLYARHVSSLFSSITLITCISSYRKM